MLFCCNFFLDDKDGKCVAVSSGKSAGLWSGAACDSSYYYICEKLRFGYTDKPIVTYDPTDPSSSGCAPGWIGYGNNCYRVRSVSSITLALHFHIQF